MDLHPLSTVASDEEEVATPTDGTQAWPLKVAAQVPVSEVEAVTSRGADAALPAHSSALQSLRSQATLLQAQVERLVQVGAPPECDALLDHLAGQMGLVLSAVVRLLPSASSDSNPQRVIRTASARTRIVLGGLTDGVLPSASTEVALATLNRKGSMGMALTPRVRKASMREGVTVSFAEDSAVVSAAARRTQLSLNKRFGQVDDDKSTEAQHKVRSLKSVARLAMTIGLASSAPTANNKVSSDSPFPKEEPANGSTAAAAATKETKVKPSTTVTGRRVSVLRSAPRFDIGTFTPLVPSIEVVQEDAEPALGRPHDGAEDSSDDDSESYSDDDDGINGEPSVSKKTFKSQSTSRKLFRRNTFQRKLREAEDISYFAVLHLKLFWGNHTHTEKWTRNVIHDLSPFNSYWYRFMVVISIMAGVFVPVVVCFPQEKEELTLPATIFEYFVAISLIINTIILQFTTVWRNGERLVNHSAIRKWYLKHDLWVDLVATVPWGWLSRSEIGTIPGIDAVVVHDRSPLR